MAVILRARSETELLFIKRAEKPGDPWSGHMAFPGGHLDPGDDDLKAAAIRETHEEIGITLARGSTYLGSINQQRAMPRGRQLDMLIEPHVFRLDHDPTPQLNYEVDEVVWANLPQLLSGELHSTQTTEVAGKPTVFNGYRLPSGHFVWGLTYRMLLSFFATIKPGWQPPPEIE